MNDMFALQYKTEFIMSKFAKGDKVANQLTNEQGFIIEVFPPRLSPLRPNLQ